MPERPQILTWNGQLFRRQINAVLDWLAANAGGGDSGIIIGTQVTVSNAAPPDPNENDIWIESATPGPSGQVISVGTTAPSSPATGDLWIDTN